MRNVLTAVQVAFTAAVLAAAEVLRVQRARRRADVWSTLTDHL